MVSLNSFSQDLIARQAPIDRKLKSVDSLALQKQIRAEQSAYPGLSLYPTWNNEYVQAYGDAIVPESYKVDLTGFCMPTTAYEDYRCLRLSPQKTQNALWLGC